MNRHEGKVRHMAKEKVPDRHSRKGNMKETEKNQWIPGGRRAEKMNRTYRILRMVQMLSNSTECVKTMHEYLRFLIVRYRTSSRIFIAGYYTYIETMRYGKSLNLNFP